MTSVQLSIAAGVGAYLLVMLAVGFWASLKVKDTADYVVAGRRLPLWMSVGTTFATWFGAETCMGSSGTAYREGLLGVIADPFGAGLCLVLAGLFFARPLYRLNQETVVDFFHARFGPSFGKLSALLYMPAYLGWVGGQLIAFGVILEALTGLPRMPAILLATGVVLVYTYAGGMWADTVTDVLQMGVLCAGLLILFPKLIGELGGFSAAAAPGSFRLVPGEGAGAFGWLNYLQAWMIVGIGSLPAQDLIQRVFAAKDEDTAARAALISGGLYWTFGLIPVLLGVFGRAAVPADKSDSVLVELTLRYLSPPMVALMVGALLSAIMSSADSALLSPAAIIGANVVPYLKPDADDALKLRWCKLSVPILGAGSLILALYFQDVYKLCQEAWTSLLVSLAVPLAAGIYWERASEAGALASAACGLAAWAAFAWLLPEPYPEKLLAFGASAAAMAVVSVACPRARAPQPAGLR